MNGNNNGFILLYRGLTSWEWYTDINTKTLFIHCLLRANYEGEEWKGIYINRGSFVTSLESLASETGLTVRQVRTSLDKLKRKRRNGESELTVMSNRKFTFITVNNYEKFQSQAKKEQSQTSFGASEELPKDTGKKFSPDSVEVMEFCKDYKELKNPAFRASFKNKVSICETLNQEGCYDKEYWATIFKRSTLGWKYSNGDIVPITLDKMLENHSLIYSGEIKLAKPKSLGATPKTFKVDELSEEEKQETNTAFKEFQKRMGATFSNNLKGISYGANTIKPIRKHK